MKSVNEIIKMCPMHFAPMLEAAVIASRSSGKIIRDLYEKPHRIKMKGEIDLVTEADIASEENILGILKKKFPEHRFIGEESTETVANVCSGPEWVIDPLDGTTNFAHGFPYFAVSIAFQVDGKTKVGVVYCPILDELFMSWRDGGAYLNGVRITVSHSMQLIESLIATGFPYDIKENLGDVMNRFGKVLPAVRDIRRAGAAALDLAYVACGRLDGFWEINLKPWDTAAGALLVEEAGGEVSCISKKKAWSPWIPEIIASNGKIHPDLISRLS